NPKVISDPEVVAIGLSQILDVDAVALAESLSRDTRFAWVKRPITPRQRQAVLEMGEPGLAFGAREVRVYPAGRLAAHILGGTSTIAEGVAGAELAGSAGIEHFANARLSDPSRAGEPLRLSLKSAVQLVMQDVLALGMERFGAKGASAILMRVETGEIVAMASLPDFDPNQRPPKYDGPDDLNPRFNRAAKGIYEFGSVMKVFTAAIALEEGRVEPDTIIDTVTPVSVKGGTFRDKRPRPDQTVEDIIVRSSNVGAIRLARGVGTERFRGYLGRLGLFERTRLELPEARAARPALPPDWTELTTVTASFGHGFSISQVHLAAAYATLANRGRRVTPSLLAGGTEPGEAVFSPRTSAQVMRMLRTTVSRGTALRADIPGYEVGGKTGTAEKIIDGRYADDKTLATFAGVFPTSRPAYVLVVTLDEPTDPESGKREASRTAVPVAGEIIARAGPLLGVPVVETPAKRGYTVPVGLAEPLDD
ncbi:MAG: penicillin-binding protein 2, partial [Pseudomonadota bacterium]